MGARAGEELLAGRYLTELLRSVLDGDTPMEKPEEISMGAVFRMAKRHSLECMAYEGAMRAARPEDEAVMGKWKERSRLCEIQGRVQAAEAEKLFEMFAEQGIRILPLKGVIMKKLYPKETYRQMSDIDILIDRKNHRKARRLMESLGYEYELYDSGVASYSKKPWMHVELHSYLLPAVYDNHIKYKDVWQRAEGSGNIFHMSWDDYYLYMIEHFAKHFHLSGSGIRQVLDIHVFLRRMGGELHRDYLEEQLRDRQLYEFCMDMEAIARSWFAGDETGNLGEKEELIISAGTYGTHEGHIRNMEEKAAHRNQGWRDTRPIRFLRKLFPSYRVMYDSCSFLTISPLLLPAAWGYRLAGILSRRMKRRAEARQR